MVNFLHKQYLSPANCETFLVPVLPLRASMQYTMQEMSCLAVNMGTAKETCEILDVRTALEHVR